MSGVRFVTPQLALTRLMAEPGGITAAEAVGRAKANLKSIRPTCRAEMAAMLDRAEAAWTAAPNTEGLEALYEIAVRGIGGGEVAGTPGVDETLKSLSDLIDAFRAHDRFDAAAVDVHLRSWRLLMVGATHGFAQDTILAGLRAVTARFA